MNGHKAIILRAGLQGFRRGEATTATTAFVVLQTQRISHPRLVLLMPPAVTRFALLSVCTLLLPGCGEDGEADPVDGNAATDTPAAERIAELQKATGDPIAPGFDASDELISGTLKAVEETAIQVEIDGRTEWFPVTKEALITRNGREAGLSDLKSGDPVQLTGSHEPDPQQGDQFEVWKITAGTNETPLEVQPEPETVEGEVIATTADTITIDRGDRKELLPVEEGSTVLLDGQPVTLTDLEAGQRVRITLQKRADPQAGLETFATQIETIGDAR